MALRKYRYTIRKMNKPTPRHSVSGNWGVWDSLNSRWVLNAEFVNKPRARRIADLMNK